MKETGIGQSVGDRASSPVERRTLLQLALAATAGAALPGALGAQPPLPTEGHPAALQTLVDRATNWAKGGSDADVRYSKIWLQAQEDERNAWFTALHDIDISKPEAITSLEGNIDGTPWPDNVDALTELKEETQFTNTIQAAKVMRDQITIARQRVRYLLTEVAREAAWASYQIGYRDGYRHRRDNPTEPYTSWEKVKIATLEGFTATATKTVGRQQAEFVCGLEAKSHDSSLLLNEAPPELFELNLCEDTGVIFGHESY